MNEPEQNQPINPDEGQEAAGAAPVSSSSRCTTNGAAAADESVYAERVSGESI